MDRKERQLHNLLEEKKTAKVREGEREGGGEGEREGGREGGRKEGR